MAIGGIPKQPSYLAPTAASRFRSAASATMATRTASTSKTEGPPHSKSEVSAKAAVSPSTSPSISPETDKAMATVSHFLKEGHLPAPSKEVLSSLSRVLRSPIIKLQENAALSKSISKYLSSHESVSKALLSSMEAEFSALNKDQQIKHTKPYAAAKEVVKQRLTPPNYSLMSATNIFKYMNTLSEGGCTLPDSLRNFLTDNPEIGTQVMDQLKSKITTASSRTSTIQIDCRQEKAILAKLESSINGLKGHTGTGGGALRVAVKEALETTSFTTNKEEEGDELLLSEKELENQIALFSSMDSAQRAAVVKGETVPGIDIRFVSFLSNIQTQFKSDSTTDGGPESSPSLDTPLSGSDSGAASSSTLGSVPVAVAAAGTGIVSKVISAATDHVTSELQTMILGEDLSSMVDSIRDPRAAILGDKPGASKSDVAMSAKETFAPPPAESDEPPTGTIQTLTAEVKSTIEVPGSTVSEAKETASSMLSGFNPQELLTSSLKEPVLSFLTSDLAFAAIDTIVPVATMVKAAYYLMYKPVVHAKRPQTASKEASFVDTITAHASTQTQLSIVPDSKEPDQVKSELSSLQTGVITRLSQKNKISNWKMGFTGVNLGVAVGGAFIPIPAVGGLINTVINYGVGKKIDKFRESITEDTKQTVRTIREHMSQLQEKAKSFELEHTTNPSLRFELTTYDLGVMQLGASMGIGHFDAKKNLPESEVVKDLTSIPAKKLNLEKFSATEPGATAAPPASRSLLSRLRGK